MRAHSAHAQARSTLTLGLAHKHRSNCTGLAALSLRGNRQLGGYIPESTGRLQHLAILDVRALAGLCLLCAGAVLALSP